MARHGHVSSQHREVLDRVDATLTGRTARRLGISIEMLIAIALAWSEPRVGESAEPKAYWLMASRIFAEITEELRSRKNSWQEPAWLSAYCMKMLDGIVCPNDACKKKFRIGNTGVYSKTIGGVTIWYCCRACYETVNGQILSPKLQLLIGAPVALLNNGPKPGDEIVDEEDEMAQLDRALKTIADARTEAIAAIETAGVGAQKLLDSIVEKGREAAEAIKRDEQAALQRLAEAQRQLDEARRILAETTTLRKTLEPRDRELMEEMVTAHTAVVPEPSPPSAPPVSVRRRGRQGPEAPPPAQAEQTPEKPTKNGRRKFQVGRGGVVKWWKGRK